MSVISTDYTTFFFIVCIHRHGMMELQLMSRNEFLLCLIKTEQKEKKILVTGSTSPRSTMLTVRAVPSPRRLLCSARRENYTGPTQMPLELLSLILGREKPNRLSETSGISRGSTTKQKVPQRFRILTNMFFFVPLETEIKLECGKERKSLTFFPP